MTDRSEPEEDGRRRTAAAAGGTPPLRPGGADSALPGHGADRALPGREEDSALPRAAEADAALSSASEVDPALPGVGEVTARIVVEAPVERVYQAFTAWDRQGEWLPLTRVRLVEGDGGVGSLVEAVTAVGPAVLRDEMRIDRLDPPYEVRVVHCGRLLRGPGVLRCTPLAGDTRTHMVWHEWFQLPAGAFGRLTWPVVWPGSKVSLNIALRRFARLVEAGLLP